MRTILSAVVGATLACAAIAAEVGSKPIERQITLAIKSSTLAEALDLWAERSGFNLVGVNWKLAKSLAAPAIDGTFNAQAALEHLLEGSPLTYRWINDKAVSILERAPPAAATTSQSRVDEAVACGGGCSSVSRLTDEEILMRRVQPASTPSATVVWR